MSLRNQTVTSVGWTSFARIIKQGSLFILSIFLMRLLSPEAYGLIGMAIVFIGFANIFKEFGFGSAIVQRSHLAKSHYSSTFYLNICIGAALTGLFIIIAPLLSDFYGENELIEILQVLSLNFVVASVGIVPKSVLQRNMRFDVLSKIEIWAAIIPGIIAVGFAYIGFGVWALVVQTLLTTFLSTILYMFYTAWKPTLLFSWRSVRHLWAYSANLTGFQTINYWARSADDLLIGKYMGSASLGIYTRAYTLMLLPINQVISVISGVMFSALSKIQREKVRVKNAYLNAMQILAFITFPLTVGLFVVAESLVLALFGQQWADAIPIIQILTWVGLLQALGNPIGWIYQSQGKTDWLFCWGICASTVTITAIVIGVWLGSIKSVAIAYAVSNLVLLYPGIVIPGKLVGMSFWDVFKVVFPSFIISCIMASVVYGSTFLLRDINLYLKLFTQILLGVIIYVSLAYVFRITALKELKKIIWIYTQKNVFNTDLIS